MTATSIEAKIIEGLFTHFGAVTLPVDVTEVYPNVPYTPDGGKYVRVNVIKNTPINRHIGGDKEPERRGFLLVTICWPIGGGIIAPSEVAGTIRNAFKFNTKIDHSGIRIWVTGEPDVKGHLEKDNYIELPVVIPWTVYP